VHAAERVWLDPVQKRLYLRVRRYLPFTSNMLSALFLRRFSCICRWKRIALKGIERKRREVRTKARLPVGSLNCTSPSPVASLGGSLARIYRDT